MRNFYCIVFSLLLLFNIHPSPVSVSDGGTGGTGSQAYSIFIGGTTATNPIQALFPGISGQILTSNGAGVSPSWTKNNGFILLKTLTAATSPNFTFTSTDFSTAFSVFMIVVEGVDPTGIGVFMRAQWSTDNGSSYLSSNYNAGLLSLTAASTTITNTNSTTFIPLSLGSSGHHSAIFFLFGMNGSFASNTGPLLIGWSFSQFVPVTYAMIFARISGNPNVNNMQIFESSGNIGTGKAFLYGLVT